MLQLRKKSGRKNSSKTASSNEYTVASCIYKFNNLDKILDLANKLKLENAFMGTNSLYKYEDSYFLVFSNSSIKNVKFIKTFVILSEYCQQYYAADMYKTLVQEKSKLIIDKKALQKLSKI